MPTKNNGLPNQLSVFWFMTRRHLMVFFKNIPTVIFTLMVPLAIFAVYILFLRQMEISTIKESMDQLIQSSGSSLASDADAYQDALRKIYGIADCWMISGVLAVSCITVSLNTNYLIVRDKESGIRRDFTSSPISSRTIVASYFAFNVIVTFAVNLIVYLICLLYLFLYGAYMISLLDFFAIIGVLLLSVMSASLITFFICSFIHTESVLSPVVAIFSAAIGFLIGAYLPGTMAPKYVNYITTFFPGTYSAGLLRNYFLTNPIIQLKDFLSGYGLNDVVTQLESQFTLNIDFFGNNVPPSIMGLVIFAFIGIFGVLDLTIASKNLFRLPKFKKKKKSPELDSENKKEEIQ